MAAALRLRVSGHGDRALLGAVPDPGTVPQLWRLWPHTSGVCAWADAALRTRSHPPLPTTGEYAWIRSLPESKGTINIYSGTPLTVLPSNHALRALTPRHPWLMHTKPPANQPKTPGTQSSQGSSLYKDNPSKLGEGALATDSKTQALKLNSRKKKRIKRIEGKLRKFWDNIKCPDICIKGEPKGEKNYVENLLEELIAANFPNLGNKTHIQVQEAERATNKINPRRSIPRPIIIKVPKIKDKERMLTAAREKQ